MITSFIEMLELPNFGHLNATTILFESRDKILLMTSLAEVMTSQPLFLNTFILRRPRIANLMTSSKLQPYLLKQPLKIQKKLKELEAVY